jgi:hypothetical protein
MKVEYRQLEANDLHDRRPGPGERLEHQLVMVGRRGLLLRVGGVPRADTRSYTPIDSRPPAATRAGRCRLINDRYLPGALSKRYALIV